MAEPEHELMQQRPLFHEQGQVDGHGEDDPGQQDEAGRKERVVAAVGDYLGKRKRRRR